MTDFSDFKFFLTRKYAGKKGEHYSPKAASDAISRLRRVEILIGHSLTREILAEDGAFSATCETVRGMIESACTHVSGLQSPAYTYLRALRIYREYIAGK